MKLFIVSGLSGSGKTIALQALEDLGMHCIDNLPAALLPDFVNQLIASRPDKTSVLAGVGIDARNLNLLDALPDSLDRIREDGVEHKIIFLDADESVLVKRFKETRRKHPMTDAQTSLLEGIARERKLLEPLSYHADLRVDTTHRTPHELRQLIRDFAVASETIGMTLLFQSFGYKHGTPLDADFVFDVRCLPNPHWQTELRRHTGLEEPVVRFMKQYPETDAMMNDIRGFLTTWLPNFAREQRSYINIAIGCTGGQHRSVYIANWLGQHFTGKDYNVQIRHRELK